jgi:hypothetical protein
MGMSWAVLLVEGDSVLEVRQGLTPLKALLDAGIIPIIRDRQHFPRGFINIDTVKRTVDLCGQYGVRPLWQLYNEPFDVREWKNKKVPPYDEASNGCGQWVPLSSLMRVWPSTRLIPMVRGVPFGILTMPSHAMAQR